MSHFNTIRRHSALLASVSGNLVLAAGLLVMWRQGTGDGTHAPAPESVERRVEKATQERVANVKEAAPSPAFHWKQLDAPDFATFVRNLRAVGCPEATIRDIIHGELAEIYAAKRQETESQLAVAPEISREVLRGRLQMLEVEETSLLASLTGGSAAPALGGATPVPASQNQGRAPASGEAPEAAADLQDGEGAVLTPAAFLVGNDASQSASMEEISVTPTDPTLDAATAQVIGRMREDFAQSLTGAGSDPSSLRYGQRWLRAQRASDEVYSSLFGGDAFVRTQAEAMQKQQQEHAR